MNQSPSETDCPLVSVIVRTHGQRGNLLRECLHSIVSQDYRPLEINVVEDGGHHSSTVADEFRNINGIVLNYLSLSPSGRCVAGNAGLAAAEGSWINFLDDDDQFLPGHLRHLVEHIRLRPQLKGVYGISLEVPTDIHSLTPLSYSESPARETPTKPFSRWRLWRETPFPIQACLFDRRLFEQYGGLDPALDNLEDWHLWMRYFSNEPIGCVEEVTSKFRVPADPILLTDRQKSHHEYRRIIEQKQREIMVTVSGSEFEEVAEEAFRDHLSPDILAISHESSGAGWPIRSMLGIIRAARRVQRKLRRLIRRSDPHILQLIRDISSGAPHDTYTMPVTDVLSLLPELQSRHEFADLRIIQLLYRCLGQQRN
ncbi:MAG: glycosyltransferase [Fuerstiella sp.]|nr:glycosyltransferase [Fuerstiella sp.]